MTHYTCIVPQPRMHRFRDDAPTPHPKMTWAEMAAAEGHRKAFPTTPTGTREKGTQRPAPGQDGPKKRLIHHETLDALRQGPGTAPQIAKRTGRDKSHVSTHVIALIAEGHKISKRKVTNASGTGGWGYLYTLEEEA